MDVGTGPFTHQTRQRVSVVSGLPGACRRFASLHKPVTTYAQSRPLPHG